MERKQIINWMIFVLLCFIWGSAFILMKWTKEYLNGYQIGAVRIFFAGLIFLPFAFFHFGKIPKQKLALVIVSGMMGNLFPAFLFAIAIENEIDSSLAGILNSLTPLFVIVLAILFFKETIRTKKIAGVIIGFIGLLILSLSQGGISSTNYIYASLILLATLMYGINVNLVSYYLQGVDPSKIATVSLGFMTVPAAFMLWQQNILSIVTHNVNARPAIIAAALLGIVGSAIATALFYILIKRAGGLFASLVTYGIPVVAIFWGILFQENVTVIQVSCLGLILGGVYLANRD